MTSDERHIVTLIEQSHEHLKDLILRTEKTVQDVRTEVREVREENRDDHRQVMVLINGLAERVETLEDDDHDEETARAERERIGSERKKLIRQIVAVVLAANAVAATVISAVAIFIVG